MTQQSLYNFFRKPNLASGLEAPHSKKTDFTSEKQSQDGGSMEIERSFSAPPGSISDEMYKSDWPSIEESNIYKNNKAEKIDNLK